MDVSTLAAAMRYSLTTERYAELLPAFNTALIQANCTTPQRVAMFCAQVGTESGGLQWMEELASGAEYEGRRDLGNLVPGDGVRYKGRGPIQVTGRWNYGQLSQWAFNNGYVPTHTYFLDNPEALSDDNYGFLGAVWYWTVARDMNSYADRQDIYGATVAVNGGTHGLQDRTYRWNYCLSLGDELLPTQDWLMTLSDQEQRELLENSRTIKVIFEQLGPKLKVWGPTADLGKNPDGSDRWLREAIAAIVKAVKA